MHNEAAEIPGLGKATVQRAYEELQDKGFLALEQNSNWYNRHDHEWRMTTKPMQTRSGNQIATNDWRIGDPQKQYAVLIWTRNLPPWFRLRTQRRLSVPKQNPSGQNLARPSVLIRNTNSYHSLIGTGLPTVSPEIRWRRPNSRGVTSYSEPSNKKPSAPRNTDFCN